MHLTHIAFVVAIVSTNIASTAALAIRQYNTTEPSYPGGKPIERHGDCQSQCSGTCRPIFWREHWSFICDEDVGLIDPNNGVPLRRRLLSSRDDDETSHPPNTSSSHHTTSLSHPTEQGCLQSCTGPCTNDGSIGASWWCNPDSSSAPVELSKHPDTEDASNHGGDDKPAKSQLGSRDDAASGSGIGTLEHCTDICFGTCAVNPVDSSWLCFPL